MQTIIQRRTLYQFNDHAEPERRRFINSCTPLPYRLRTKLWAALEFLGERWILTRPVERVRAEPPKDIPAFLRKQAS